MHAVTWQTVRRASRRIPAVFIAGQRRHLPRARPFHITSAARYAAVEPPPSSNEPRDSEHNGKGKQELEPQAADGTPAGAEVVSKDEERAKLVKNPTKNKVDARPYTVETKRSTRTKNYDGVPAINIPPRFLKKNVSLAEEMVAKVGEGEVHNWKELSRAIHKTLDEISVASKDNPHDELLNTAAKVFESNPNNGDGNGDGDKPRPFGKGIHLAVIYEVLTAISASLSTAHRELGKSFPSVKSNLILHTPIDGGMESLEEMIWQCCAEVDADVITLDAQDIAELVGDYFGDGQEPSAYSIRSLGYETHRSRSEGYEMEEDEVDEYEGEEDAEDPQEDPMVPTRSGNKGKKQAAFVLSGVSTVNLADLFRSPNGPKGKAAGRGFPGGDYIAGPMGRPQSTNAAQWDDMKLGNFLDELLLTNSTKRAEITSKMESGGKATSSSSEAQNITTSAPNSPETNQANPDAAQTQQNPSSMSPRTVVLIKDYKELSVTRQGAKVLDKITDIVHKRRQLGAEIMVVGLTASAELVPEFSRSSIKALQAENEDSFFRTIVVPIGPTVISHDAHSKSASHKSDARLTPRSALETDNERRNFAINERHIKDMFRRLDPNFDSRELSLELVQNNDNLESRVLAFHEVHRLALTAIGIKKALAESPDFKPELVRTAMTLLRLSDDVKFAWAAHERLMQNPKDVIDEMKKNKTTKTAADHRLERVQKTANKHEKKLLTGVVNPQHIKTTFNDVHATAETIEALKTMTSLSLQRPDAFTYGVLAADKIPGLLLYGPPGTGKTLLAKAVAKESGATVLEVSGSEVYDMYVGEGEKNVRALFSLARKLSPCVVFIDEADAIFGSRSGNRHRTSHREILNQFLKEWDGMNDLSVFIMVATNRPFDIDDAVLRRLPRRLLVDLPAQKDRKEILQIHLKDEQLDAAVSLDDLALRTPFYSGSDLKNLCVSAALACVREENAEAARFREAVKASQAEAEGENETGSAAEDKSASSNNSSNDASPTGSTTTDANPKTITISNDHTPPSVLDSILSFSSPSSSTSSSSPETPAPAAEPAYTFPARRTLRPHHFEQALREIGASVSEDMSSLAAIRKFDEQYGDKRGKRRRSAWGFHLADMEAKESDVRVRK
ncbi:uncharacterized protein K452DRAFT_288010 [Aplosporella prunicola CBS 121167]|uniref:AAA+ ATPase domain-containing protein n=1 Tax=Aplosporella prunicola CBS 121167 TaxID=1176127 RepID=A0A6A6BEF1_9PEZI|nr:uncharacterized protein K452DRAFT_288010 [Aplosporella prunicola CBS 121167]KAF2141307.1 hypothetical protein K452DRAFT_288010 [Aplosporella prunicola CBS 121167]